MGDVAVSSSHLTNRCADCPLLPLGFVIDGAYLNLVKLMLSSHGFFGRFLGLSIGDQAAHEGTPLYFAAPSPRARSAVRNRRGRADVAGHSGKALGASS